MFPPGGFFGDALQEVQGRGVLLGAVAVERWHLVARQSVVGPLLSLFHLGLASVLPAACHEEPHVLVSQGGSRRDGTLVRRPVVKALQVLSKSSSVQKPLNTTKKTKKTKRKRNKRS